jgi:CHAT domain-containing protein/tetratricopeptide (TPR) repeat protein
LLLSAVLCPAARANRDTALPPQAAFREAEKKFKAGELTSARRYYKQVIDSLDTPLRRLAYDRVIEITQRLELFDQTVREGWQYRRELLEGPEHRSRWVEVTVEIGMAYECLAQYRAADQELLAARRSFQENTAPMLRLLVLTRLARLGQVLHRPDAGRRLKEAETACVELIDTPRVKLTLAQRSEAVWRLAENYHRQDRHVQAVSRLAALLTELDRHDDQTAVQVETLRLQARHEEALGRHKDAAKSLRRAIELYRKLPKRDRLVEAELLDTLGDVFGKGRQPDDAARSREEATRAYLDVWNLPKAKQTSPFARERAFWRMERLYEKMRQYEQALQLIEEVKGTSGTGKIIDTVPRFKALRATLNVFVGKYADARELFREAVRTLEAGNPVNLLELPRALNSLAIVEQDRNRYDEAEKLGLRCLALYRKHDLPLDQTLVEALNLLGTNATFQGRFKLGVERFREGAAVCEKLGRKADRLLSTVLLNHTLLYMAQKDLALTAQKLQQAMEVYQRSEEPDRLGLALFECALARLKGELGDYPEAFRLAQGVLEQCRTYKIVGGPLVNTAKHCRALGHFHRREFSQAKELWSELRKEHQKSGENLLPRTLNYLGMLAEIHCKPDEAIQLYHEAGAAQEKQLRSIPSTHFVTLWRLAHLLDGQGKRVEARKRLMQAIGMIEAVRQETYGDAQQRTTFLAQFVPAFEQAVAWAVDERQYAEAFNLASRVRGRAFLDQLLLAGADPRGTLKGRQGEELRLKEEEIRERLAALRGQLLLLPGASQNQDRVRSLLAELARTRKDFTAVWRDILNASPVYSVLADEAVLTRPLALLQKKALPPRTALLAYHLQRERAYALLVTADRQAPEVFDLQVSVELLADLNRPLPAASAWGDHEKRRGVALVRREEIQKGAIVPVPAADQVSSSTTHVPLSLPLAGMLVEHYRCLLESPRFSTLRGVKLVSQTGAGKRAVRDLPAYAEVLLPLALRQRLQSLDLDHLLVVPDGPLHKLPLEALVLQTEPGTRFVLDELPPVSYVPSISALAYLLERPALPKGQPRSLLSVSDPAYPMPARKSADGLQLPILFTGALPRLPFTDGESKRIRSCFPRNRVMHLEFRQATEKNVTREAGKHSIIHIAAHGFAEERSNNLFGALVLSPPPPGKLRDDNDGFLRLYEIYRLPLSNCELAVLSACQTNVGPQAPLESGVTLASGFLAAGSRRVVASHWSVDDRSTAALMGAFFEEITQKKSSYAQALQKARKQVRSQEQWASPFHWAPFVLIGAGEQR